MAASTSAAASTLCFKATDEGPSSPPSSTCATRPASCTSTTRTRENVCSRLARQQPAQQSSPRVSSVTFADTTGNIRRFAWLSSSTMRRRIWIGARDRTTDDRGAWGRDLRRERARRRHHLSLLPPAASQGSWPRRRNQGRVAEAHPEPEPLHGATRRRRCHVPQGLRSRPEAGRIRCSRGRLGRPKTSKGAGAAPATLNQIRTP